MSEEGAYPEVLEEFEVNNPDFGWYEREEGELYSRKFDLADPRIWLFDERLLTPEVILKIEEWAIRLSSSRYNQGREYLFQMPDEETECYCCLALPFLEETWYEANEDDKIVFGLEVYDENDEWTGNTCNTLSLPPKYYKQLALFGPCGEFRTETGEFWPLSLANVNDELGWNFRKISKLVTLKLLQAEDRGRAVQVS